MAGHQASLARPLWLKAESAILLTSRHPLPPLESREDSDQGEEVEPHLRERHEVPLPFCFRSCAAWRRWRTSPPRCTTCSASSTPRPPSSTCSPRGHTSDAAGRHRRRPGRRSSRRDARWWWRRNAGMCTAGDRFWHHARAPGPSEGHP